MNPYSEASESNVRALSAAQRYAAALLLYNDDFHFKRKQSVVSENVGEEDEEEEEVVEVKEVVKEEVKEEVFEIVKEIEKNSEKTSTARSVREKAMSGYSVEDIMNDRRLSAAARGLQNSNSVNSQNSKNGNSKNKNSKNSKNSVNGNGQNTDLEDEDLLYIVEGAYRILDEGISMFREGDVFNIYYESRKAELASLKNPTTTGESFYFLFFIF